MVKKPSRHLTSEFLHAGKPGRMSLSYDCLEVLRPVIADSVMRWIGAQTFKKDDFAVFEGGIVRLSAPVAKDVAALTVKAVPLAKYLAAVRLARGCFDYLLAPPRQPSSELAASPQTQKS